MGGEDVPYIPPDPTEGSVLGKGPQTMIPGRGNPFAKTGAAPYASKAGGAPARDPNAGDLPAQDLTPEDIAAMFPSRHEDREPSAAPAPRMAGKFGSVGPIEVPGGMQSGAAPIALPARRGTPLAKTPFSGYPAAKSEYPGGPLSVTPPPDMGTWPAPAPMDYSAPSGGMPPMTAPMDYSAPPGGMPPMTAPMDYSAPSGGMPPMTAPMSPASPPAMLEMMPPMPTQPYDAGAPAPYRPPPAPVAPTMAVPEPMPPGPLLT